MIHRWYFNKTSYLFSEFRVKDFYSGARHRDSMSQREERWTIGVFVSPDISIEGSSGAEEHVLNDIGEMLGDQFEIELVGGNKLSNRIKEQYDNHNALGIWCSEYTLVNALLLPFKIFNGIVYASLNDPDVLFNIGGSGTNGLAVTIAGLVTGTPTVVRNTGNTFSVHEHQSDLWGTLRTWTKSTILSRVSFSLADRVLTLGEDLKESLIANGIEAEKIEIIPQPLDLEQFSPPPDKRAAKEARSLPPDSTVALTVARLQEEKGADRLANIIRETLEVDEDIVFCVVGRGEYQSEFESLSDHDRVVYHEYVPHEEIHEFYEAADVFILPSRIEGVPNVVLESLATGVPVLATPVGEVPHMIDETVSSVPEFVERLRNRDFERQPFPERYTWDALAESYQDLFVELAIDSR